METKTKHIITKSFVLLRDFLSKQKTFAKCWFGSDRRTGRCSVCSCSEPAREVGAKPDPQEKKHLESDLILNLIWSSLPTVEELRHHPLTLGLNSCLSTWLQQWSTAVTSIVRLLCSVMLTVEEREPESLMSAEFTQSWPVFKPTDTHILRSRQWSYLAVWGNTE